MMQFFIAFQLSNALYLCNTVYHTLKPFWLVGALKPVEEEVDLRNQLINHSQRYIDVQAAV